MRVWCAEDDARHGNEEGHAGEEAEEGEPGGQEGAEQEAHRRHQIAHLQRKQMILMIN